MLNTIDRDIYLWGYLSLAGLYRTGFLTTSKIISDWVTYYWQNYIGLGYLPLAGLYLTGLLTTGRIISDWVTYHWQDCIGLGYLPLGRP